MRGFPFCPGRFACCISSKRLPSSTKPDDTAKNAPPSTRTNEFSNETTEAVLSSLEGLPVEIQIAILAESTLTSLRTLIKSSPRFYHVFYSNKLLVLNMSIRQPERMLRVLDDFGPWQAEEILCVHEFAKEKYTSIFVECAWELNQVENPKYNYIPILGSIEAVKVYSDDCENIHQISLSVQESSLTFPVGINEQVLATMLSLGLFALRDSLEAETSEDAAEVVDSGIYDGKLVHEDDWIDGAVGHGGWPQYERHYEAYSEHDEAQDRRQEVRFDGDDLFSPPSAWVAFWGGRYSNLIGAYVPQALYRWGYVMWDAKRLEDSGAMEFVDLEWQCKYGVRGSPEEDDPRVSEFYYSNYDAQVGSDGH